MAALQLATCVFATESGGGASATEQSAASEQTGAPVTAAEKAAAGCDGKGREKCLGDDPYYIAAMSVALTIAACLLGAYIYCKVRDIGNIDRTEGPHGHVDKVMTDNYGKVIQGDPTQIASNAPDIRLSGERMAAPVDLFS
jgi:hypothetical protein